MAGKRELNPPHPGDKRLQRRDNKGRFAESDDVGRSFAQDQHQDAEREAEPGQGERSERKH